MSQGGEKEHRTYRHIHKNLPCIHPSSGEGPLFGPHPQYGSDFEILEKFRKDPGNALRAFAGIPVKSTAGIPQTL